MGNISAVVTVVGIGHFAFGRTVFPRGLAAKSIVYGFAVAAVIGIAGLAFFGAKLKLGLAAVLALAADVFEAFAGVVGTLIAGFAIIADGFARIVLAFIGGFVAAVFAGWAVAVITSPGAKGQLGAVHVGLFRVVITAHGTCLAGARFIFAVTLAAAKVITCAAV